MNDSSRIFDILVVGGGGSGLAAAASGAEHGASVLVLEKRPVLGGTTGIAVGSFTANRTRHQRRSGIEDGPEAHARDAGAFAPPDIEARNHPELRAQFLSQANETLEWLEAMGLVFQGPNPEPPNSVPRMHNVVPGARAYIHALRNRILKNKGKILCNAEVRSLIRKEDRIVGVEAVVGGTLRRFRARKGVVLAAGDYANAPDLIGRYKGESFGEVEGINLHSTGDGHRLAESVGAELLNMDITYGPELRFLPPKKKNAVESLPTGKVFSTMAGFLLPWIPRSLMHALIKSQLVTWQHPENALFRRGAILINQDGNRFCNELDSPEREIRVAHQPAKIAYILLDHRLITEFSAWPNFISTAPEIAYAYVEDYLRLRPDVAVRATTLEGLAHTRGIDPLRIDETVSAFNETVAAGEVDEWGRNDRPPALEGSDWVLLGPAKAYFTTTEGSAAIDMDCRVLDKEGKPISGLYAVGQNGLGGQILWGHGLHIAWALTSGRKVGIFLAAGLGSLSTSAPKEER